MFYIKLVSAANVKDKTLLLDIQNIESVSYGDSGSTQIVMKANYSGIQERYIVENTIKDVEKLIELANNKFFGTMLLR